ncbi:hypothetical protein Tco_1142877 [Tanacetum coccineum]
MSDSSFSDSSDLDDIAEYEMIMEINNEDQDEVEAVQMRRYINRERDVAEERLMADYFGPHPKYPAEYFRRRYRMNRELFLEIVQGIENYIQTVNPLPKHFQFFTIRYDCTGLKSFSVIMKCTSAIRQLAYGTTPDALDEYAISEAGEIYICPQQNILRTWVERCAIRQRKAKELRDKQTHSRLQRSLIEHVWALHQP